MDVTITCPCPTRAGQTRHPDGDTVTLRDALEPIKVRAIRNAAGFVESSQSDALTVGEQLAMLTEGYITFGIEAWTLVDDKGRPVEVSRREIHERILSDDALLSAVGEAADELYSPVVLLPLLNRVSPSSPPSPTESTDSPEGSTSPPTESRQRHPRPSKRSSTTTSRTDAIAPTSMLLDGGSS